MPVSQPEQLILSKFFGNADPMEGNPSLFLQSSLDLHQYGKIPRYNSPRSLYKHQFRGIILFRIKSVLGHYNTRASLGGERAHIITGCSCSCCFAQSIILVSSLGSSIIATTDIAPWHFGQTNGSTS